MRIRLASPDIGDEEAEAVRTVLTSGVLTNGPATERFEAEFASRHEVEHAVAFSNGTTALAAILLGMGVGPGDEVIVPSFTFVSTATSVIHAGAAPVFADVDRDAFHLDPEDVTRRLTARTKAVIAVHYGGQVADMNALRNAAGELGLIEDAAPAHGASYRGRPAGGLADAAMFSFTPTKNITTGEGGIVTTGDAALARRLRLLRNHGQTSTYVHECLGYNWRLTEMQAAMGSVQLRKLDDILARKRANAEWMGTRLASVPGITPPVTHAHRDHAYAQYTILVDEHRDQVLTGLLERGIEARVYFPPAHRQPMFSSTVDVDLPATEWVAQRVLSLPFHSRLSTRELEEIAGAIEASLQDVRG